MQATQAASCNAGSLAKIAPVDGRVDAAGLHGRREKKPKKKKKKN
jgi:hypothetical protein